MKFFDELTGEFFDGGFIDYWNFKHEKESLDGKWTS